MTSLSRLTEPFAPLGPTLLRAVVGLVFVMHGTQKVFTDGIAATQDGFATMGIPFPGAMGVAIPLLELVGGLLLIAGLGTRLLALAFVGVSFVAAITAHADGGFFAQNGGWEYLLILGVASLTLAITGPGLFAVDTLLSDATTRRDRATTRRPGPARITTAGTTRHGVARR